MYTGIRGLLMPCLEDDKNVKYFPPGLSQIVSLVSKMSQADAGWTLFGGAKIFMTRVHRRSRKLGHAKVHLHAENITTSILDHDADE